jgi:class 3 adenylate cyclase
MDYSVIGDTVNVAARLEGVAGPGEVVITDATRNLIGDAFRIEERQPVNVKGKSHPLRVYNVLERIA